jgi:hypothetical protein
VDYNAGNFKIDTARSPAPKCIDGGLRATKKENALDLGGEIDRSNLPISPAPWSSIAA